MLEKHRLALGYVYSQTEDPRIRESLAVTNDVLRILTGHGLSREEGSQQHGESKMPVVRPVESANVQSIVK